MVAGSGVMEHLTITAPAILGWNSGSVVVAKAKASVCLMFDDLAMDTYPGAIRMLLAALQVAHEDVKGDNITLFVHREFACTGTKYGAEVMAERRPVGFAVLAHVQTNQTIEARFGKSTGQRLMKIARYRLTIITNGQYTLCMDSNIEEVILRRWETVQGLSQAA